MSATRSEQWSRLESDSAFDVVVVGGGVNGIGVYRDLAMQGLRVLLVEREDFASGCSAAPSRMIHGGLRYLENGEFDLVRESLRERDLLLANAPHMVRPMPTLIPISSVFSGLMNGAASFLGRSGKPANRGALPIKLGLSLYDWVTRKRRVMPRHRFNSGRDTRRRWPDLTPEARFSAVYYDAWISHPERLCIEMLRDVARDHSQAVALNYAEIASAGTGYEVRCTRTGARRPVQARAIVNATGAWLDSTAESLGKPAGERMVSGTKGSHLIIDNAALHAALDGHLVYFENADGRICIVFPYLGHVLAGSTDIRVAEARKVRCEADELDYILASLRLVFPAIPVSPDEVVFSYSGIRPLPKSDHDFTGRISRGHLVRRLPGTSPQFCMVGGKWTTFRAFAEQTADAVLAELGHARLCDTAGRKIGGGAEFPASAADVANRLAERFGIDAPRAAHLADHYGYQAFDVMAFCAGQGDDAPLAPGLPHSTAEVDWLIANEFVETVSDIVLRRTSLAITGRISADIIMRIAERLAKARGLTAEQIARQTAALTETLSDYHGVTPEVLEQRNHKRREKCA
ncbi:glycerol-3-phosphate dehydrogenase/oxidase [Oceanibium sediminis]|uniref:glycerol-3-phosphate dehydrogenase/oxidase n=1 Tax=Oceanibium sediminis TaxID=2026339 RepID=UPI000DD334B0|nr:glycerol-3-phosphate dehydrogenase/oxidase [Oceanibium sediminis]